MHVKSQTHLGSNKIQPQGIIFDYFEAIHDFLADFYFLGFDLDIWPIEVI